jgi:hypothetical protein
MRLLTVESGVARDMYFQNQINQYRNKNSPQNSFAKRLTLISPVLIEFRSSYYKMISKS